MSLNILCNGYPVASTDDPREKGACRLDAMHRAKGLASGGDPSKTHWTIEDGWGRKIWERLPTPPKKEDLTNDE